MSESKKKSLVESDDNEELSDRLDTIKNREDDEDAPVISRKDAYDASLDVPDPEDLEKNISKADIEKEPTPTNIGSDDEDEITSSEYDIRLLKSKSTGNYAIATKKGSQIVNMVDVPSEYVELAKTNPVRALEKIQADKEAMPAEMSDEDLMEVLNEMLNEGKRS